MNRIDLDEKYEELEYAQGYDFMMCPESWLKISPLIVLGLNPAGKDCNFSWDWGPGNFYISGPKGEVGQERIRHALKYIQSLFRLREEDIFSANYIPFRSENFKALGPRGPEAKCFSNGLWQEMIPQSPAKLIICMGDEATWGIKELFVAKEVSAEDTGWGSTKFRSYDFPDASRRVVSVPHPSWYPVFSGERTPEEIKFATAAFLRAVGTFKPTPTIAGSENNPIAT